MVVPGCHLESPQALLAAEGSCKLLSEVPGARGVRGPRKVRESLERHTLCTAIPCKYAKSGLCKVLIHTSSAWFHVKKKMHQTLCSCLLLSHSQGQLQEPLLLPFVSQNINFHFA